MLIEVCANSLESALNAEKAGADRIELCSELGVGGITPSYGLIAEVKKRLQIPIHVLIRPRSGHFTYSEWDFEVMKSDIDHCRSIGIDGIVSGVLQTDSSLDLENTSILVNASKPMKFTFHRAFDWIHNPLAALQQLEGIGVDFILTSGQEGTAERGLKLLQELNRASTKCRIMAGGGIRLENAKKFKEAGLAAIHLSGTAFEQALTAKPKIPMNSSAHINEGTVAVTNEAMVRQIIHSVK